MKRLHYAIVTPAVAFLLIAGSPAVGAQPQSRSTPWSTAAASAAQGSPLTLPQAIQEALDNNQRLAVADAAVDEAEAGTRQAGAHKLPRVDVSYLFQRTNNPVFVFGNLL
ncbi:MAG: TolC family protein, partial [Acidobacteriota bacterium]